MKLKLENASSMYGSQMGRRDVMPDDLTTPCKLRLERLRWVYGDYDQGGAYWGYTPGTSIYCAWGDVGDTAARFFVRAKSRDDAKRHVKNLFVNARFYR